MISIIKKTKPHEFLGFLAILPFFVIILLCLLHKENYLKYLDIAAFYLSIIVSFIGASYWGISLYTKKIKNKLVMFTVMPAIIVVFFYLLEIDPLINLILCTLLMNMIIILEKTHFLSFIPNWYFKLRVILNTLVTAMVFIIVLITTSY